MKAFTDISQSKKLAKILPLKSADMGWNVFVDGTTRTLPVNDWDLVKDGSGNVKFYPCQSLAALMAVIPYNVSFNKAVYRFKMVKYTDHWECYHENFGSVSTEIFKADNPIDACVAMIEKLHEQKLL